MNELIEGLAGGLGACAISGVFAFIAWCDHKERMKLLDVLTDKFDSDEDEENERTHRLH